MATDGATTKRYDALILGGGPAGLTAAIYMARAKKSTLVIDTGTAGGQMVLSHKVANYPGVDETSGYAISQTMLRQAQSFGAEVLTQAEILSLDISGDEKVIIVEDEGTFIAPVVIIAAGGVPRRLGVPGEERFEALGISYCATCDGDFFTDKPIAVVGGGNSALEEAVSLTKYASKVTVIHEFDHFQAQPWLVAEAEQNPKIEFVMNQRLEAFEGETNLERVVTTDKGTGQSRSIEADGCFVFIGYAPNTGAFADTVELNARGEIITDEEMRTSVTGVFAAGDSRAKRYRQITTAVADGTIAALSAVAHVEALGNDSATRVAA